MGEPTIGTVTADVGRVPLNRTTWWASRLTICVRGPARIDATNQLFSLVGQPFSAGSTLNQFDNDRHALLVEVRT